MESNDPVLTSKTCILHLPSTSKARLKEQLKEFTDSTWFRAKEAETVRKNSLKNSKFFVITLPESFKLNMCYHSSCYSEFTAISKQCKPVIHRAITTDKSDQPTLRSSVVHPSTSSTGVFETKCLFCGQGRKWAKGKFESLGDLRFGASADKIYKSATILDDSEILAKISGLDLLAKQVKVHHSCRNEYIKRADRETLKAKDNEKTNAAYELLKKYVQQNLVDIKGAEKLTSLYDRYLSANKGNSQTYRADYVKEKLLTHFNTDLKICKASNKGGIIFYNAQMPKEEAIRRANFDCHLVKEAAYYLRSQIKQCSTTVEDLPSPLTGDILKKGQCAAPPELVDFFTILYGESRDLRKLDRIVQSSCDDVVFNVTNGKIKPGKHITLAMTMKSLTGSRKVVEILNRLGHSTNYHTVEEIETQMASEIADRKTTAPDGILQEEGLCTSLAWDNYDENTETLSGSGTLHDTVGICYQNEVKEQSEQNIPVSDNITELEQAIATVQITESSTKITTGSKRKRSYQKDEQTLAPYRKKPKMSMFNFHKHSLTDAECNNRIRWLDTFWVMNVMFGENTPMWAGWNSTIQNDPLPKQRILYMDNITLPPTRLDVVAETLRRSQRVAEECGEKYVAVTYDLAVAKPALQIQAAESPLFDNVFICFGAFHILLAYFGALGHFIDGSGGTHTLIESEVLAEGSATGFITGKHYNRCVRMHEILACAFHSLHMKKFLKQDGDVPEQIQESMFNLKKEPSQDRMKEIEALLEYSSFMQRYDTFTEQTMSGTHGSTAKYWMIYVRLVGIYLKLSRACRTNNLKMFISALGEMIPVFFAMNRSNYARWMVRYYYNLINVDKTHPGLEQSLQKGAFTVKRTDKQFSRIPVDMALEQTVNADAASRQTGIAAFTSSEDARRRWMVTRAMRSQVVRNMLDMADLTCKDDVAKTLRKSRIERDNSDIKKVVQTIEETMNPFEIDTEEKLYCLATGKEATAETTKDLLGCIEIGKMWEDEFTNACFEDPSRFEKPIPRRKIRNFNSDVANSKITTKDNQIIELRGTRDLFGRLLCISSEKRVDLMKVFTYPLIPVPLSIGHMDGTFNITDKSKLMEKVEKICVGPLPPPVPDVVLVDATFMLHTLQGIPRTMGDVSRMILALLCKMGKVIHFVCDTYKTPSIKDMERTNRGEDGRNYKITGRDQKAPSSSQWQDALRSKNFKSTLFQFLAIDWERVDHSSVIKNHEVFIGFDDRCLSFTEENGSVRVNNETSYNCSHEEADTRLVYHLIASQRDEDTRSYIVRSNDTDVLLLLVYHVSIHNTTNVWMDAGLDGNNTRRYINVSSLSSALGSHKSSAILGLHSFTGCDYTGAFYRKGKTRALDILLKDEDYMEAFGNIGNTSEVSEKDTKTIEKFVCHLYSKQQCDSVDNARYQIFVEKYKPGKRNQRPLTNIKGMSPSSLPPCRAVLKQKLKRTNYVVMLWKKADEKDPVQLNPKDHGWKISGGQYEVDWFKGNQLPESVVELLSSLDDNDEEVDKYSVADSDSDNEVESGEDED